MLAGGAKKENPSRLERVRIIVLKLREVEKDPKGASTQR